MLEFDDEVDSIAFGIPGSTLDGLMFISHDEPVSAGQGSELTMVDLATMHTLAVATGGSRGDEIKTTPSGRVLISQSHQVDVLGPVTAPNVVIVNPPPGVSVALPLGSISVTFDQDMLNDSPTDPAAVVNPSNFRLQGDAAGSVPIRNVAYDPASRTAVISFDSLTSDHYKLQVLSGVTSAIGVPLAHEFDSDFTTTTDLSSIVALQFSRTRSNAAAHTMSFDVQLTNTSTHGVLLPVVLHMTFGNQFDGSQVQNAARAADGSWLIDLSGPGAAQRNPGTGTKLRKPDHHGDHNGTPEFRFLGHRFDVCKPRTGLRQQPSAHCLRRSGLPLSGHRL